MHFWIYCVTCLMAVAVNVISATSRCSSNMAPPKTAYTASTWKIGSEPSNSKMEDNKYSDFKKSWCPSKAIDSFSKEYLQVDLGNITVINTLITAGQESQGSRLYFVRRYKINYTRSEKPENWITYTTDKAEKIIKGNDEPNNIHLVQLQPAIIARYIRIIPFNNGDPSEVCLKLKITGCMFQNQLVSYEAPRLEYPELDKNYSDLTYDNSHRDSPVYSGGLGKLTDLNEKSSVGWRRDFTSSDAYIDITFRFANLREFTEVKFLTDNNFHRDIRFFKKVEIHSSRAGSYYDEQPAITKEIARDDRAVAAQWIAVDLKGRVATFLRVRLYFAEKWIILKEVVFNSKKYEGPSLPAETIPIKSTDSNSPGGKYSGEASNARFSISATVYVLIGIATFLFILIMVAAFLLCLYFKKKERKKKKQLNMNNNQLMSQSGNKQKSYSGLLQIDLSQTHPLSVNGKVLHNDAIYTSLPGSDTESNMSPEYASASLGGNTQLYPYMPPPSYSTQPTPLMGHQPPLPAVNNPQIINNPMADMFDRYRTYVDPTVRARVPPTMTVGTPRLQHPTLPKLPVDQMGVSQIPASLIHLQAGAGNSLYFSPNEMDHQPRSIEDLDLDHIDQQNLFFLEILGAGPCGEIHLAEIQQQSSCTLVSPASSSSVNDNKNTRSRTDSGINGTNLGTGTTSGGSDFEEEDPGNSSQSDLVTSHITANKSTTGRPIKSSQAQKEANTLPIGGYPSVHTMTVSTNGVMPENRLGGAPSAGTVTSLVAVKMLRKDAHDLIKENFFLELRILSRLKNPNLAALVGVYEDEKHMCLITEYQQYGDLHQFLQTHYSTDLCNNMQPLPPNTRTLSYAAQIYMAVQVASACKYLESLQLVHRDIACRNCLVGPLYTIKISDIGASRRHYSTDYFRPEANLLMPVRWMAWESIIQGRFSCKSDVWSFAVTLWEIITLCREQPFQSLSDSQIIQQANLWAAGDNRAHRLTKPNTCPKETWDLMVECWCREEHKRPSFREIHMFLHRLNQGYDPREEPPVTVNMAGTLANSSFTMQNRNKAIFTANQSPASSYSTTPGLVTSC